MRHERALLYFQLSGPKRRAVATSRVPIPLALD